MKFKINISTLFGVKNLRLKIIHEQDGIALLWALITIAVLLAIAGSMASVIIKESQMSSGIDSSVKAYAAAESGIEQADYLNRQVGTVYPYNSINNKVDSSDAASTTYDIFIINNGGGLYTITSIGKDGKVTREIEKDVDQSSASQPFIRTYDTGPALSIGEHSISWLDADPIASPNITLPISGSYTQIFKVNVKSISSVFSVGLSDVSGNKIMFNSNGSSGISLTVGGTTASDVWKFPATGDYIVKIDYQKNTALKVTIIQGSNLDNAACKELFTMATLQNFNLTKVRFEQAGGVSWSTPTVKLGSSGNVAEISYMGLQVK